MNRETIDILRSLNNEFYREQSSSFSATRRSGWPGWDKLASIVAAGGGRDVLDVLDVACGNMRFERFLAEGASDCALNFTCVDNCVDLARAEGRIDCEYLDVDVIARLADGAFGAEAFGLPEDRLFDMAVSFGFMHHVPGRETRRSLLKSLVDVTRPGGIVAVSLWRFAADGKLAAKAQRTTQQALASIAASHSTLASELEAGDYFVGWNDAPGVFRYCHSFDETDVADLLSAVDADASLVERYRADGRTGEMNAYLVLSRR